MTLRVDARDSLTGAHSRASLQERLAEEVDRGRRYGTGFSLLIADLDYFKSINDAFSHTRGDQALVQVAERMRSSDLLFRYGGDEFVLLLPNTGKEQARLLAEQILNGVRSQPFNGEPPVTLH